MQPPLPPLPPQQPPQPPQRPEAAPQAPYQGVPGAFPQPAPMAAPQQPPSLATPDGGPRPVGPEAIELTSTTVTKSNSMFMRAGLVVATVAVAGAGYVAVDRALSEPAGPQTPMEAAQEFFVAVENEDVLGMTEVMLPSERESLVEPSLAIFSELERLQMFDSDVDLGRVDDLDVVIEGLALAETSISTGLSIVEPVDGTISVRGVQDLSFGSVTVGADEMDVEPEPLADRGLRLAIVEEDGSWYVSLYYSIAEAARTDLGRPAPVLGAGPTPVGAATPEAAVQRLVERMVDLDPTGVLTTLDPREARALYDYSYLFLPELEDGARNLRAEAAEAGLRWNVEGLEVSSRQLEDRTVATIDGIRFLATDGSQSISVELADGCVDYVLDADGGQSDAQRWCEDDLLAGGGRLAGLDPSLTAGSMTLVERDGAWYVSTMPSILYAYRDLLAGLQPGEIEQFIDDFGQFSDDASDLFIGSVGAEPAVEDELFGDDGFEDELFGDDGFEFTEAPMNADVVPVGSDGYGLEPDFWTLSFEIDPFPGIVVTSVSDGSMDMVEVATLADPDLEVPLVTDALLTQGWVEIDADGLPPGSARFAYADFQEAVIFDNHVISYWIMEERPALATIVVNHLAG